MKFVINDVEYLFDKGMTTDVNAKKSDKYVMMTKINGNDVGRVKAALTRKINDADITFVIIGKEANKKHSDSVEIGYKKWINFEIAKSKDAGNDLLAIKINQNYDSPDEVYGAGAKWAMSFTDPAILNALNSPHIFEHQN